MYSEGAPLCTCSISPEVLHDLWVQRRSSSRGDLPDPKTALAPAGGIDVLPFFPLFDTYIYQLVNHADAVAYATRSVLRDFHDDGVAYLELRTTPRQNLDTGLTKDSYVFTVNREVAAWNARQAESTRHPLEARIILSIDRKMSAAEAEHVVDLAIQHKHDPSRPHVPRCVVGVDLCGNPGRGDVSTFTHVFRRATQHGLGITAHFAEIRTPTTPDELETILSWAPQRLGHVINVPARVEGVIRERRLALELCLSCNVLAKLTSGGFGEHHFKPWHQTECPIALSTDDVGIFGSPLSHEYLLAAQHFGLSRQELIKLAKSAASAAFDSVAGKRTLELIAGFEKQSHVLGAPEVLCDRLYDGRKRTCPRIEASLTR
ncbi:Metallo-dependent hydrolase [Teratosphaeria destructans]|uniref:Metallo-dependent hydrolase n=1 Tax=Teratosphaeria destructans TaxID=418781 RepID=A0A9W7SWS7_9PEZI|nr:Metallo-dependent hydrolase [Teratosphaeria destructans]